MFGAPKRSALMSACLHAAAIVVILVATRVPYQPIVDKARSVFFEPNDLEAYKTLSLHKPGGGGGGGGMRDLTPATEGRMARPAVRQFVPQQAVQQNPNPQLTIEPAILVDPRNALPQIEVLAYGVPGGVKGPPSGGPGSGGGGGNGDGGGLGDGHGPGVNGPGGGGYGGDAPGGGGGGGPQQFTNPVLMWKTEPEYSEEARRAKLQGTVVLKIEIDARGVPRNPKVQQSLGLGLDERAVETVMRWRFHPATRGGRPVPSVAMVEVTFRLL
jgi:TonB family protein